MQPHGPQYIYKYMLDKQCSPTGHNIYIYKYMLDKQGSPTGQNIHINIC